MAVTSKSWLLIIRLISFFFYRTIYYLNETWVNARHTKEKVWIDTTVTSRQDAFSSRPSKWPHHPACWQHRWLCWWSLPSCPCKAGCWGLPSGNGPGACFQKWFVEQLLTNIRPRSVIVMVNASYHTTQLEKVLSSSTRKAAIHSWLMAKNIPFSNDQQKSELL